MLENFEIKMPGRHRIFRNQPYADIRNATPRKFGDIIIRYFLKIKEGKYHEK
jgi:hypothetical protein